MSALATATDPSALTAGSAVWNTIFVCAGCLLGESWGVVQQYPGTLQWVVVAVVVVLCAWFVVGRLRARRLSPS